MINCRQNPYQFMCVYLQTVPWIQSFRPKRGGAWQAPAGAAHALTFPIVAYVEKSTTRWETQFVAATGQEHIIARHTVLRFHFPTRRLIENTWTRKKNSNSEVKRRKRKRGKKGKSARTAEERSARKWRILDCVCKLNVPVLGRCRPFGRRCRLLCVPCAGALDVHLHDDVHHRQGQVAGHHQLLQPSQSEQQRPDAGGTMTPICHRDAYLRGHRCGNGCRAGTGARASRHGAGAGQGNCRMQHRVKRF